MKLFGVVLATILLSACGGTVVPRASCVTQYTANNTIKNQALSRGVSEEEATNLANKVSPISENVCTKEEIESLGTASTITQLF